MARGKRRPNVRVMRRMCVQRRRSMGASETAWPSGTFEWPPCAEVRGRRTVRRSEREIGDLSGREALIVLSMLKGVYSRG